MFKGKNSCRNKPQLKQSRTQEIFSVSQVTVCAKMELPTVLAIVCWLTKRLGYWGRSNFIPIGLSREWEKKYHPPLSDLHSRSWRPSNGALFGGEGGNTHWYKLPVPTVVAELSGCRHELDEAESLDGPVISRPGITCGCGVSVWWRLSRTASAMAPAMVGTQSLILSSAPDISPRLTPDKTNQANCDLHEIRLKWPLAVPGS